MKNTMATNLLSGNFIQALSGTLLHSLWQGVILAITAGLIMMLTHRSTPAVRYQLLLGALVLFTTSVFVTFMVELNTNHLSTDEISGNISFNTPVLTTVTTTAPTVQQQKNWVNELLNFLDQHSRQLVVIWTLMVCMRSFQLLSGMQGVYKLKRSALSQTDLCWQQQVAAFAQRLGVTQLVTIAESGVAKVPMVIGHLKPVILIPLGLFMALSQAEVEAIILHELAHIRRRDYLVNLLQSLLEVLLFFNPAVLWVSALLRTERENCCDDLVIEYTGNRINYIKALLACQEQQFSPSLAMAAAGKSGSLLNRVNRMVSGRNTVLNQLERGVLMMILLIAGLGSIAFTRPQLLQHLSAANHTQSQVIAAQRPINPSKTKPASAHTTLPVEPDMAVINDQKAIIADSLQKQADLQQQVVERQRINVEAMRIATDSISQQQQHLLEQQRINADAMRITADSIAQSTKLQSYNNQTYPKNSYKPYAGSYDKKATSYPSKTDAAKRLQINTNISTPIQLAVQTTPLAPVNSRLNNLTNKSNSRTDAIISDMINDGIIANRDGLSFKIGIKEFIVNGKKQSDAVFQKYKANYVKAVRSGDDWSWFYNYDPASGHTTETTSATTTTNN